MGNLAVCMPYRQLFGGKACILPGIHMNDGLSPSEPGLFTPTLARPYKLVRGESVAEHTALALRGGGLTGLL